jgi:hypothetical protein
MMGANVPAETSVPARSVGDLFNGVRPEYNQHGDELNYLVEALGSELVVHFTIDASG